MLPVLSSHRFLTPGGSWVEKCGGVFQEGDPIHSDYYYEGRADIKELGGFLRVFFQNITVVKRQKTITDAYKKSLIRKYREDERAKEILYGIVNDDFDEDDLDNEELSEREQVVLDELIEADRNAPIMMPNISLFLSAKKPKARMVDVHITGSRIYIPGNENFGNPKKPVDLELSLRDIPDALGYMGIVAVKMPKDAPKTEEPIVYGFVKLQSARHTKEKTSDVLRLTEISEELAKILVEKKEDHHRKKNNQPPKDAAEDEVNEAKGKEEGPLMRPGYENVKSLKVYRQIASQCWASFSKAEDEEVDFKTFLRMLDKINIFMITIQARRIFDAIDVGADQMLGISEFENFLIANDILGNSEFNLVILDVFDSLKSPPLKGLLSDLEHQADVDADPRAVIIAELSKDPEWEILTQHEQKVRIEKAEQDKKEKEEAEKKRKAEEAKKPKDERLVTKASWGLDYSGFCEGIQMLGVKEENSELILDAFCSTAGIKPIQADSKYLNLSEFRKGFLKLANLEEEMKKRNIKFESGTFAQARNRERLNTLSTEAENVYLDRLKTINTEVDELKADRRRRKDQKKREKEEHTAKLQHAANKFIAVRAQEKRLVLKKEQEEKSKKRNEDKILRNKLLLRQQENMENKLQQVIEDNKKNEKLRQEEIKKLNIDRIDYSARKMRSIEPSLYKDNHAQMLLGYAQSVDFSHNIIDHLPEDAFFFSMTTVRKVSLAQNRIKVVPKDVLSMKLLEIFELESNRIEKLPRDFGQLYNLKRLNLSNNQLTELPESIGLCTALVWLSIHSNKIQFLPHSIGDCFKLEYFDLSNNSMRELPEHMENMVSLAHLDCNTNQLGNLYDKMGNCTKLSYLDVSTNQIAYLPSTFSQLVSLEYCNVENNSILVTIDTFNNLSSLKLLNMKKNSCVRLYPDMGGLVSVNKIDCSVNEITTLPIEIGRMTSLVELNLHDNQIEYIPPEVGSCTALHTLDLSNNAITGCLPDTMGLIRSLVILDISNNRITELPRSIIGFQRLESFTIRGCLLTSLPDTITHLTELRVIDMHDNRFNRFPIELKDMVKLETLDLSNNRLTLLPRNINAMHRLTTLNLSRNMLRAVPVEFTDIFETVRNTDLTENPWDDYPPKWGKLWEGRAQTDGHKGYSLSDAVDFLYGMRAFYNCAEQIWTEVGAYHYTGRLSLEDFLQELRDRIPKTWDEGLVEYVKHVYFKSRETGVFVRWYSVEENVLMNHKSVKAMDRNRREANVLRSKSDLAIRDRKEAAMYAIDLSKQAHQLNELTDINRRHARTINEVRNCDLYDKVMEKQAKLKERADKRENKFHLMAGKEMIRLQEILQADEVGRKEAKRREKLALNSIVLRPLHK